MTKSRDVASHSDSPFALTSEVTVSVFFIIPDAKGKEHLASRNLMNCNMLF